MGCDYSDAGDAGGNSDDDDYGRPLDFSCSDSGDDPCRGYVIVAAWFLSVASWSVEQVSTCITCGKC